MILTCVAFVAGWGAWAVYDLVTQWRAAPGAVDRDLLGRASGAGGITRCALIPRSSAGSRLASSWRHRNLPRPPTPSRPTVCTRRHLEHPQSPKTAGHKQQSAGGACLRVAPLRARARVGVACQCRPGCHRRTCRRTCRRRRRQEAAARPLRRWRVADGWKGKLSIFGGFSGFLAWFSCARDVTTKRNEKAARGAGEGDGVCDACQLTPSTTNVTHGSPVPFYQCHNCHFTKSPTYVPSFVVGDWTCNTPAQALSDAATPLGATPACSHAATYDAAFPASTSHAGFSACSHATSSHAATKTERGFFISKH